MVIRVSKKKCLQNHYRSGKTACYCNFLSAMKNKNTWERLWRSVKKLHRMIEKIKERERKAAKDNNTWWISELICLLLDNTIKATCCLRWELHGKHRSGVSKCWWYNRECSTVWSMNVAVLWTNVIKSLLLSKIIGNSDVSLNQVLRWFAQKSLHDASVCC